MRLLQCVNTELAPPSLAIGFLYVLSIGVLFGCFGRKIDGPGLPGG